jgi:hypothetical protein
MRVEFVEIQILFVIYKIELIKKKNFLIEFGVWAESMARPSWPHRARAACAAQLTGAAAQRTRGRALRSGAKTRPVKLNSTR